jgi:hypothetical protein
MTRFADRRAELIHQTGFARGIPRAIAGRARRLMDLLLAAHEIQDVRIIGEIWQWKHRQATVGLSAGGRWYVTFTWDAALGAKEISIERR